MAAVGDVGRDSCALWMKQTFYKGKMYPEPVRGKVMEGVPVISCVVIECECVYYWLYQYI